MRKNRTKHEAKKPRLAKRALALCFALIFVCSCLLPAFANSEAGALSGTQETVVEQQDEQPTDPAPLNEGGTDSTEGNEEQDEQKQEEANASKETSKEPSSSSSGEASGESQSTAPSESASSEGSASTAPGESASSSSASSEASGEPEQPASSEPKTEQPASSEQPANSETKTEETKPEQQPTTNTTGDTIEQGKATYTYRFWPDKIDAFDLEQIDLAVKDGTSLNDAAQSQVGRVPCTVLTVMTNANLRDYQANVQQPTKDGYEFAGWYTVDGTTEDEFSFEQSLNFEESQTIDVFAKWNELVTLHATTTVDVDATLFGGEAAISLADEYSYEDDRMAAPTKTLTLDVEATNLSSNSELSVSSASSSAIEDYCDNNELVPILTLDITPKDNSGNKTEPQGTSTVTISGLSELELPDELTMVHKKDDGTIETIPAQYSNGTLTFEATSFSTYAVAAALWETGTLEIKYVDENGKKLRGDAIVTVYTGTVDVTEVWAIGAWRSVDYTSQTTFNGEKYELKSKNPSNGRVTVRRNKTSTITLTYSKVTLSRQYVYLYTKIDSEVNKKLGLTKNDDGWFTVGYIEMSDFLEPTSYRQNPKWTDRTPEGAAYYSQVVNALSDASVNRFGKNSHVHLSNIDWNHADVTDYNTHTTEQFGLVSANGATDYNDKHNIPLESNHQYAKRWHLDGYIDSIGAVRVNYYIKGTTTSLKESVEYLGTPGETFTLTDAPEVLTDTDRLTYKLYGYDPANSVVFPENSTTEINVYYVRNTLDVTIVKKVDSGDETKDFKFKVTSNDFSTTDNVSLTNRDGTSQKPQDDFYLKDGESATLKGLKKDYIFTIEEEKENSAEYDTTATENIEVEAGKTKSFCYKVVEENGQLVLQPIAEKGDKPLSGKSNITDGKVVVTNSAAATSLTVTKKVESSGNAAAPANAEFTFRLTVSDDVKVYSKVKLTKDGNDITKSSVQSNKYQWEFTLKNGESVHISGIRLDDSSVKVEEVISDNHYTTKHKVNDEAEGDGKEATFSTLKQNSNTVVFTNTYSVPNLSSMTIQKKVTGEFGDRDKSFTFNVELKDKNGNAVTGEFHTSENGANVTNLKSFTLKHDQQVTLENIPIGTTITVTETGADEYETSAVGHKNSIKTPGARTFTYEVVEKDGKAVLKAKNSVLGIEVDKTVKDNAIIVTNNFDGTPDTGVLLDTLPYLILLAVAVAGGVLVVVRKRKHRDE